MDTELTPEQRFNAESPEAMVPRALMQGRNTEDVVAELVRLDWSPEEAKALIERVSRDIDRYRASPETRRALLRECRGQFVGGLFLALFGLVIALLGFSPLTILFLGFVLGGFVLATRGYLRWRSFRRDLVSPGSHIDSGTSPLR